MLRLLLEVSAYPPIFSLRQLEEVVIGIWANSRIAYHDDAVNGTKQNAGLFATLVVCSAPSGAAGDGDHGGGAVGDGDHGGGGGGSGGGGDRNGDRNGGRNGDRNGDRNGGGSVGSTGTGSAAGIALVTPRNPCLVALRLATACEEAARDVARDRLRMNRLLEAETMFEFVASGLVHCADRDAQNAAATKGYNMWRMGTSHIEPGVACDIFVQRSVDHAAQHEARVFISQPLVYEHLHDIFWPDLAPPEHVNTEDGGALTGYDDSNDDGVGSVRRGGDERERSELLGTVAHWCRLMAFNALCLPLLPLLPHRLEDGLDDVLEAMRERGGAPLVLVWAFPSGRFALWFCAMAVLALLVTATDPRPDGFSAPDVGLLAFLVGMVRAEVGDVIGEVRTDWTTTGRVRRYLSDPFNILDLLLVALLATLLAARRMPSPAVISIAGADASAADGGIAAELAAWEVPAQGLLALVAWLRLLQILFVFSRSGPLLLMTIRMLDDLWQFLMLASIIIMAFACAFYVVITHEQPGSDVGALSLQQVLGLLVTAAMKGEPDHIMLEAGVSTPFAHAAMYLFGVVVVLLLLNLLIARFAKTYDLVYENVDANFKVAFARVVVEGCKKDLMPPPLNLVRDVADIVDATLVSCVECLRRCNAPATGAHAKPAVGRLHSKNSLPPPQRLPAPGSLRSPRSLHSLRSLRSLHSLPPMPSPRKPAIKRVGSVALATVMFARDEGETAVHSRLEDAEEDEAEVAMESELAVGERVEEYLAKALSQAQSDRGTLVDQIVHFVTTRW